MDRAAVAHPHMNRQVEHANGLIMQGLKPRILTLEGEDVHTWLSTKVGKWAAEVPSVLWSLRTMTNRSNNFSLFFMVYGVADVLPTELQYKSPGFKPIDLLEESRDITITRIAGYQQTLR
jgi:hypothetical protein